MNETQWRRRDLDCGKTLAVLLVVLGHLVARQDPAGPSWGAAWYEPLRATLYTFHIPFLFYLSGYAAGWSGAARLSGGAWRRMVGRRATRWLLPAVALGLIILSGKCLLAGLVTVDHAPASFTAGLLHLAWQTQRSPAQSVWYLFVLFAYAALVPGLLRLCRGSAGLALLLALALMPWGLVPDRLPPLFYADRILLYLPFYLAGLLAHEEDRQWCAWLDRARAPLLGLFAALLALLCLAAGAGLLGRPERPALLLGASLVAIPALHAAVRRLPFALLAVLDWLRPHAFAIYLLNTIFIGLAKACLLFALPWQAVWFPLFAPCLFLAGVLGPVCCNRMLLALRTRPPARLGPSAGTIG
ncbi:acyltransferase family protein [Acidisoma sp. C75]